MPFNGLVTFVNQHTNLGQSDIMTDSHKKGSRTIAPETIAPGSKSQKIEKKLRSISASELMTQCKIELPHVFSMFIKNN